MKALVATGFCAAMALSITAYGQTWSFTSNGITYPEGVSSSCDVVDKTPNEVNECKLKYWKWKLESLQKNRADLDKKVDEAKERIQAFSPAKH